ncbi:MAG: PAS domain-containing protein [Planctomycetes bacterium]|nr:PAS domain-containing protein [Planctomycetota bacterium]
MVGVGTSAGGLHALTGFLSHLPADTGMAFILVPHLSPGRPSQLATLLRPVSRMPIEEAVDQTLVMPNRVYVIAPNTSLVLKGGVLHVSPRDQGAEPHRSIDIFLGSLALDRGDLALAVLLSGTGSDGTRGCVAIKAAGGITFADDTAEAPAMPLSAIGHGCIDFVMPPRAIALELGGIARDGMRDLVQRHDDAGPGVNDDDIHLGIVASPDDPASIARIIAQLRTAAGIDFTHYRPTTIRRRVARRMRLTCHATMATYADLLARDAGETAALVKDVLINVTGFFRDREAYDALARLVLPKLTEDRAPDDALRIWVIACSTGQEVYSIAIELLEHVRAAAKRPLIQIFATDISDHALAKARSGRYPPAIAAQMPADRLARYFTKDEAGYRISREVRDLCVFAKHDITVEIPYARMDLISCRNVLIYLDAELQRRVFPTLHFALKPSGYLLLGASESVGDAHNLFHKVDGRLRIFSRIPTSSRARTFSYAVIQGPRDMATPRPPPLPTVVDLQRAADRIMLGRFAPPGVLVNAALEVIQFRGRTSQYLEPNPGDASLSLLTMVPFAVAEALRKAVSEAQQQKSPVRREHVMLRREREMREIAFEVVPVRVPPADVECFLILFMDQDATGIADRAAGMPAPMTPAPRPAGTMIASDEAHLRNELALTSDYLHSLTEQVAMLSDQLKASQEECQSTSEEYRSTNEELQTAMEEIESSNEELISTNEELRQASTALREHAQLNSAIVETMRLPLLVLDSDLRVRSANRAFLRDFQVGAEETEGRLVYELGNGGWDIPNLRLLLEDILPSGSTFDDFEVTHDFPHIGRRIMLLNARKLESADAKSFRIVLVIVDITERSRILAEVETMSRELRRSNQDLDEFAAVASHDLQEPLRMISNYTGLLALKYTDALDERARGYMGFITSGSTRMSALISAILEYSRIGQDATPSEPQSADQAMRDALTNLKLKIATASATVSVQPLPRVRIALAPLSQVFQNLVSNGLKFRSDKRPATIDVSVGENESDWIFSVADNGIGMDERNFARAFQLFQRLNAPDQYSGTGIGLATCKKIIERHGGRIWVESQLDVGSTFFFTVPKSVPGR